MRILMATVVAMVAALLVLAAASLEILSAGRAYVAGEGLWSKGQKDAVAHLQRFARTGDAAHFAAYRAAIAVPLGDRMARLALDRAEPDYAAAREGFLQGRNHPADVDAMARLFVWFRRVPHIAEAIEVWTEGDRLIVLLEDAAERLRAEMGRGRADPARVARVMAEVESLNDRLTPLEDAFSAKLGEATRWVKGVLTASLLAAAILLLGAGAVVTRAVLRQQRLAAAQLQNAAERFEFLAHHDRLTGLPNRAMLDARLREALAYARRRGRAAAVLYLDLDRFKEVNDNHGHDAGDRLLKAAAERLRAAVRGEDFVARVGGDEFCVLLQDLADPREAGAVAQKVLDALAVPHHIDGRRHVCGASVGIACAPKDAHDAPALLRIADGAMYRAKESGRNGYRFADPEMNRGVDASAGLAAELEQGLERGELFIVYQPRLDFATRQVVGAEAQVRWPHPRFGLLPPEAFLPIAEESDLIVRLGAQVLRDACREARRWREGSSAFRIAVNLSLQQLRDPGLPAQVRAALAQSGLPPDALLLEVPESAVRQVPGRLHEALAALAATGARLCVDDFGSGYASLPALQSLRFSAVSIERRLVAGLPADAEAARLVRGLVALARSLGIEVILKGIDMPLQRDFALEAGGRIGQGGLLALPLLPAQLDSLLRLRRVA